MSVRVRFAPSPTGKLHLGGARTALFNFLFARSQKGIFLLRIEDTDKERSLKEFEDDIIDSLNWLGLKWDEEIIRQSDRVDLYAKIIKLLLDKKLAYYCFCSKEELEARKQEMLTRGETPIYSGKCRHLDAKEIQDKIKRKVNYVLRLRIPEKTIVFRDFLRGEIKIDYRQIGDFVIAKNEFEPLYVLANTVDDHYQGITHIIRGEEFLHTTPKQILLYKYLEWDHPIFVHLPLVLGQDRSKLSKRHGAKSISEYRQEGYLPEAILNFIALLGWHPNVDNELMSLEEMIKSFQLEKLNKSPAIFNTSKLNFFNKHYLKLKPAEELLPLLDFKNFGKFGQEQKFYANNGCVYDLLKIYKIIDLGKERATLINDILNFVNFFFNDFDYDAQLLLWKNASLLETKSNLIFIKETLDKIKEERFDDAMELKNFLDNIIPRDKRGYFFWPLRVALSGKDFSPPPFDLMSIFGKEKTLNLISKAIDKLSSLI
ncbi:MAG: glutamate--tRNA ligase [Candidatus Parcubacteria bacterium]|nr:MAG: glutamate--tRNA ligase [Candidatus Parcubacteria bacterium]